MDIVFNATADFEKDLGAIPGKERVRVVQKLNAHCSLLEGNHTGFFKYDNGEDGRGRFPAKVEIHRIRSISAATEPLSWHKMLFSWRHIEEEPTHYLNQWLNRVPNIGMPLWLYLGSFREGMYEDQRFMELAQALEGYHRYRFPEKSEKTAEHEAKLSALLTCCPEESKKWLSQKLEYSHEPSLRKRLKDLFSEHKQSIQSLTGSWKNAKDTIGTIVTVRNTYAHCLGDDPRAFTGHLRHRTVRLMRAVMAMLLLEDAGFKKEQIEKIASNDWGFKQLQRYFCEEIQ